MAGGDILSGGRRGGPFATFLHAESAVCLTGKAVREYNRIDGLYPSSRGRGSTDAMPVQARKEDGRRFGCLNTIMMKKRLILCLAVMLALTIKLYERYHTLDLDEIYMIARQEEGTEEKV